MYSLRDGGPMMTRRVEGSGRGRWMRAARLAAAVAAAAAAVVVARPAAGPREQAFVRANTLTEAEVVAGWRLLFDGKTTTGWRGFHREAFPTAGWTVEGGALAHMAGSSPDGGDIITAEEFDNFDLQLEWRISPGGNSGIKYLISEDLIKTGHDGLGFEMQVLDDDRNPDAKAGKDGNRRAGALSDLIPPAPDKVLQPVGDWNVARVLVEGTHVEHWLNGRRVLAFDIGSPDLTARIADSKFKNQVGFGEVRRGHILLQDHGNAVWFRDIKIRPLRARPM